MRLAPGCRRGTVEPEKPMTAKREAMTLDQVLDEIRQQLQVDDYPSIGQMREWEHAIGAHLSRTAGPVAEVCDELGFPILTWIGENGDKFPVGTKLFAHPSEDGRDAELPREAPLGLLVSMAIRFDHGLGVPGYYDAPVFDVEGVGHAKRLRATISAMRQLYEEVSGHGFYSPEKEASYAAMAQESGDGD
jgi:hypothetical protein